jgi:hypothetical protein
MGQNGFYFPSEGRRAEDFFALKNPTASAGFEPADLGTKGQHTTCGPPKSLILNLIIAFEASGIQKFLQCWQQVKITWDQV